MNDADQVVQTLPAGVAQATAALQLWGLQQAALNTAHYVSLRFTFNAQDVVQQPLALQMRAWGADMIKASFDSLADLFLLLFMRLAWLMQAQPQQHSAQLSSSSSSNRQQMQQPVPCWHEQFLAAAGAAAWDANSGHSPPWHGVADLREAT
jgi:hypothetical protein